MSQMITFRCWYCNAKAIRKAWRVKPTKRKGHRLYCSRICSDLGRKLRSRWTPAFIKEYVHKKHYLRNYGEYAEVVPVIRKLEKEMYNGKNAEIRTMFKQK